MMGFSGAEAFLGQPWESIGLFVWVLILDSDPPWCPCAYEDGLIASVIGLGEARTGCYMDFAHHYLCSFVGVKTTCITQPNMEN